MSVSLISVPTRADMARGIGQCILHGVEYEVLGGNPHDLPAFVEITCADEVRLNKIISYFNAEEIGRHSVVEITPDLPRRENIKI